MGEVCKVCGHIEAAHGLYKASQDAPGVPSCTRCTLPECDHAYEPGKPDAEVLKWRRYDARQAELRLQTLCNRRPSIAALPDGQRDSCSFILEGSIADATEELLTAREALWIAEAAAA